MEIKTTCYNCNRNCVCVLFKEINSVLSNRAMLKWTDKVFIGMAEECHYYKTNEVQK